MDVTNLFEIHETSQIHDKYPCHLLLFFFNIFPDNSYYVFCSCSVKLQLNFAEIILVQKRKLLISQDCYGGDPRRS